MEAGLKLSEETEDLEVPEVLLGKEDLQEDLLEDLLEDWVFMHRY